MAIRLFGRSPRAPRSLDAFCFIDVLRLVDDCGDTDLRVDRNLRSHFAGSRAHRSGPWSWRRIWNQRNLPHGDGRPAQSRLLLQFPIRDADRRTDLRAAGALCLAEGISDQRGNPRLGLAHPILYRRAPRSNRAYHAAHSARDRGLRGGATGSKADIIASRTYEISARGLAGGWID